VDATAGMTPLSPPPSSSSSKEADSGKIDDDRIDIVRLALEDMWITTQEAADLMRTPVLLSASREQRVQTFHRFV